MKVKGRSSLWITAGGAMAWALLFSGDIGCGSQTTSSSGGSVAQVQPGNVVEVGGNPSTLTFEVGDIRVSTPSFMWKGKTVVAVPALPGVTGSARIASSSGATVRSLTLVSNPTGGKPGSVLLSWIAQVEQLSTQTSPANSRYLSLHAQTLTDLAKAVSDTKALVIRAQAAPVAVGTWNGQTATLGPNELAFLDQVLAGAAANVVTLDGSLSTKALRPLGLPAVPTALAGGQIVLGGTAAVGSAVLIAGGLPVLGAISVFSLAVMGALLVIDGGEELVSLVTADPVQASDPQEIAATQTAIATLQSWYQNLADTLKALRLAPSENDLISDLDNSITDLNAWYSDQQAASSSGSAGSTSGGGSSGSSVACQPACTSAEMCLTCGGITGCEPLGATCCVAQVCAPNQTCLMCPGDPAGTCAASGQTCPTDGGPDGGCDPTSCPTGCCDSAGTCQPGTLDTACGGAGQSCAACTGSDTCGGGGTSQTCGNSTDAGDSGACSWNTSPANSSACAGSSGCNSAPWSFPNDYSGNATCNGHMFAYSCSGTITATAVCASCQGSGQSASCRSWTCTGINFSAPQCSCTVDGVMTSTFTDTQNDATPWTNCSYDGGTFPM